MEKLNLESKNIVGSNIEKICELFPNVVTEGPDGVGINFDILKQELSDRLIEDNKERYQLTWPGKHEAIYNANTRTTKTLRPLKEKSVDFENTQNIYIEGDNLEVLKILQESYLGKIKCIYIDPPYNTGKDFIYKDNFQGTSAEELIESRQVDELGNRFVANLDSNGRYHSDWLSMMYPRLKLARNLLTIDGVIFISIDDKEVHNLKKICDEIFGIDNFQTILYLQVRYANKSLNEDSAFQPLIETVLVYSKNSLYFKPVLPIKKYDIGKFCYKIVEKTEGELLHLNGKKVFHFAPSEFEIIKYEEGDKNLLKETWASGSLLNQGGTAAEFLDKYIIPRRNIDGDGSLYKIIGMGEEGDGLGYRYVTNPTKENSVRGKFYTGIPLSQLDKDGNVVDDKNVPIVNYYDYSPDFGNIAHEGGVRYNSGKKPIKLLMDLLGMVDLEEDIILDFFSGSASMAHAVMELNLVNKKKNKFILVQLNELIREKDIKNYPFISSNNMDATVNSIAIERIRKSSESIRNRSSEPNDIGYRYYKVDESNMKDIYYKPNEISQDLLESLKMNIKEDRSTFDLLTQVILDLGLTLDLPINEKNINDNLIIDIDDGILLACFDDFISIETIEEMAKYKNEYGITPEKIVVKESAFKSDHDLINANEKIKNISLEIEFNLI